MSTQTIYVDGAYLAKNPTWHAEDSPWKARQISRILDKNQIKPSSVCEVGCGAGEILHCLAEAADSPCDFIGYEISPAAFEMCRRNAGKNLQFHLKDLLSDKDANFDVVMAIDVFEHVEDYIGFLRKLRVKGRYKIFHIPLDLSVQTVLRGSPLLKRRQEIGHLHYFTKETALASLRDAGYEIVDSFYTKSTLELPGRGWRATVMMLPRNLLFSLHQDLAVRILGGYSLLVLAT